MSTVLRLRTKEGLANQIGPQVKERIKTIGITNSLLCGRVASESEGLWIPNPDEITHVIRGRRAVTTVELAVLARALETSAAWLMGE